MLFGLHIESHLININGISSFDGQLKYSDVQSVGKKVDEWKLKRNKKT